MEEKDREIARQYDCRVRVFVTHKIVYGNKKHQYITIVALIIQNDVTYTFFKISMNSN